MRAPLSLRRLWRIPFLPACGAVVLVWLALTPSLLPRPAAFQGLLCGVAAILGYGLGAFAGWLVRSAGLRLRGRNRVLAWRIFKLVAITGTVINVFLYLRWQRALREALEVETLTYGHLTVLVLVTVVVAVVLLVIARLLRGAGRWSGALIARVLPRPVAAALGGIVTAILVWTLVSDFLAGRLVTRLDSAFMVINSEFSTDVEAPAAPELSGGPTSGVAWEDLGRQGRVFVLNAPTAEQIGEFSTREAIQPVRAYVGVSSDGDVDLREQAQIAVDELERTGGFERAVLNVVTGTGRGWVNENQATALEYMWNGDVATVSMQYSYLPSWMSFLVDGERAQDAGRLLFDAVHARVLELPESDRPLLVVSGESLGTFGGEAAFSGAQDLVQRTDGALFVGPTGNNRLWSQFSAERDPGSPQVLPVYQGGHTVRFADKPEDWWAPGPEWPQPRIGYLQHPNDPITWWTMELAVREPDWLREAPGRDIPESMRWIPLITMLQVAADQAVANAVPAGEGHEFGAAPARAWSEILPPPEWTDADAERLEEAISALKSFDSE